LSGEFTSLLYGLTIALHYINLRFTLFWHNKLAHMEN
jgi:hypothetical protein